MLSFPRILEVTLPEKQGKSQKEKSKEIQKSKIRGISPKNLLRPKISLSVILFSEVKLTFEIFLPQRKLLKSPR